MSIMALGPSAPDMQMMFSDGGAALRATVHLFEQFSWYMVIRF